MRGWRCGSNILRFFSVFLPCSVSEDVKGLGKEHRRSTPNRVVLFNEQQVAGVRVDHCLIDMVVFLV